MWKKVLAGSVIGVAAVGFAAWYFVDNRIRSEIDNYLQSAVDDGTYEALYYEDFSYDLNGEAHMSQLHVKQAGVEFVLDQVKVSDLVYVDGIPRQIKVQIFDVQFPAGLPDLSRTNLASVAPLLEYGMQGNTLPLQLEYTHLYDPDNAFQVDSTVTMSISGLTTMDFNSRMRNIPLEDLSSISQDEDNMAVAQAELMQVISQGAFPSLFISIEDEGLVQAYMTNSAADFAVTPEEYRTMLVTQARNLYLFLPQSAQGLGMTAGIQLASFLEGGKTLTISLQPEFEGSIEKLQPQLMGAMFSGDYTRMVELLNLKLETR